MALIVPITMQAVEAQLPEGGSWQATSIFAALKAGTGMPWWLAAWLFPLVYCVAAALLALVFESLLYLLRFDRADRSWSSVAWTLRGWRAALAWTLLPLALMAVAIAPGKSMEGLGFALAFSGVGAMILPLVLPFFVLKPDYVAAARPVLLSRPAWPGWLPVLVLLAIPACSLAMLLLSMLSGPSSRPTAPLSLWLAVPLLAAVVLVVFVVSQVGTLYWLNAHAGAKLAGSARTALKPRVILARIAQDIRWYGCLLLPTIALLPVVLFLVLVFPRLEDQLACCLRSEPPILMALVEASRFMVAWWWAMMLGSFVPFENLLGWFSQVGRGRLLHELELVEQPSR